MKAENSAISFGKIDSAKYLDLQKKYRVSGYPALRFFAHKNDVAVSYDGERSIPAIKKWLGTRMKDPWTELDTMDAAKAPDAPALILGAEKRP